MQDTAPDPTNQTDSGRVRRAGEPKARHGNHSRPLGAPKRGGSGAAEGARPKGSGKHSAPLGALAGQDGGRKATKGPEGALGKADEAPGRKPSASDGGSAKASKPAEKAAGEGSREDGPGKDAAGTEASEGTSGNTSEGTAESTAESTSGGAKEKPEAAGGKKPPAVPEREVIVPDELLEPPSPVDTTATVQQVKQRQVFKENPNIYYMNGESLSRPMTLPPSAKIGIIVIIVVAAVLAAVAFYAYFDATTNEPAREQARMQESIDRAVTLDLPDMLSLLELDDATIDGQLKATGATFFERSALGSGEDYEIVKLPSDVTLADAAAMYATGIGKLSPSQAATLLNGAWDLQIERSNGLDMVLHYADFKSGDERSAIANAIASEGLERGTETDSGDNDGYGNHFTKGTIMINGATYDWAVSAVSLKDVYSVAGLPDDAVYVGIRIKGAAE